ncbi:hypothetical protein MJN54_30630, partial [Salmonella enterica subsp. enterica serovar Kentucky]|nr:hypothetical protein [Salmonella enterica subsp. enterica serovar Kentucky]
MVNSRLLSFGVRKGETAVIIKNLTRRRNRLRRNKITAFSCHTVRL